MEPERGEQAGSGGRVIFLIAGEASGDAHGAALIRALRRRDPDLSFAGLGGAEMRLAGGEGIEDWTGEAAVLGLWEVLKKYRYFRRRFRETLTWLRTAPPAAVVFIDYPGFNLRLAGALANTDGLVLPADRARRIFYISPQVWAWNRGRIPKMARILDRMLCIFPFEKPLYESSGLETTFVGHPFVDELRPEPERFPRERDLVGLFPGSREREVVKHFPIMLGAARLLREQIPDLRFAVPAATAPLAERMARMRDASGWNHEDCAIETGGSRELMQRATVGAVASGTATLEAAFFRLPYCLVYQVAWPTYLAARALIRIEHLGIVNVLAGRGIVRELIQQDANPGRLAAELGRLLGDGNARRELVGELDSVVASLGCGGSHEAAAMTVMEEID